MFLHIKDVLTPEEITFFRQALGPQAPWIEGARSAGGQAIHQKNNLQLAQGSELSAQLQTMVKAALHRNAQSYVYVLAGYTACMIVLPAIEQPMQVFALAVTRVAEVGLGIICSAVVSSVLLPRHQGTQVMRTVPAGLSRSSVKASSSASISSKRLPMASNSRSPAGVGETLRVVRVSKRMPRRSSKPRMVWLSADWETPIWAAARVKLPSLATVRKAIRSL